MTTPTANSSAIWYNFYRRYKWTAADFTNFQQGVTQTFQGLFDGMLHGAALQGLGYLSATGLNFSVDGGVAVGPTGNLLVSATGSTGAFASPTGGNPARSLVVIRPSIVPTNYITQPTTPFALVPLQQLQQAQVLVLNGLPASAPAYPATGSNDVILFGVRLAAGATGFATTDLDLDCRDIWGKNSIVQRHTGKYDDRCRPYRFSNQLIGIKPSQLGAGLAGPRQFTFINKTVASLFPRQSSAFVNQDTFLNFQSGAITGGDTTSSAFTPTIPGAGTFIVAAVSLGTNDTLTVSYGVQGTYAQCQTAIINQSSGVAAGSIPAAPSGLVLAWVILASADGVNITDVDVYDARTNFAFGGAVSNASLGSDGTISINPATQTPFTITSAMSGAVFLVNSANGVQQMNLPTPAAGLIFTFKDIAGQMDANGMTLHRAAAENIEGLASDYVVNTPWYEGTLSSDGTNWYFSAG